MKEKTKGLFKGIIIGFVISTIGIAITANASTGQKSLTATYRDIKIVVGGETIIPTNGYGDIVEPFIVDGTTYLPVRAVAAALGKTVGWDDKTNSVLIDSDIKIPDKGTPPEITN